jgi:hypothetical protein
VNPYSDIPGWVQGVVYRRVIPDLLLWFWDITALGVFDVVRP